jgi:hypothetical protein
MTVYRPQGVSVEVLNNPNLINIGGGRKIPAIVGFGPSEILIIDEPVKRGSGLIDALAVSAEIIEILSITSDVKVTPGSQNYKLISDNGALYAAASASVAGDGQIEWEPRTEFDLNIPRAGDTYYVTYKHAPIATQYNPTIFTDSVLLKKKYGEEDNYEGILSAAGSVVLENGSPAVMVVQVEGDAQVFNEGAYKLAIDKLQKKDNISYIVPMFPSGSVTRSDQDKIVTYAYTHTQLMNNNARERGLIVGSPSEGYAEGGFDEIGDALTSLSYLGKVDALMNENVTYVVPSEIYRGGLLFDANLAAAAIAGLKSAQLKQSTPIHGFVVAGIEVEEEKWTDFEMDQLGAGSCLVLEQKAGMVTVRDAITTDPTSADTQEMSVVDTKRLVKKTLRTGLANVYTNKGKVIDVSTPGDVIATTSSILDSLINDREISTKGVVDNPLTGETKINAQQNPIEPRKIDVTCSYKPLYPLKWISVTVSVFV